jgi:hypothetical protein
MSPDDSHAYFSNPPFNVCYKEVHISVVFTWDIAKAISLMKNWQKCCQILKMGGPAFDDRGGEFVAGKYLKRGITITSRGCPHKCSFCLASKREGGIRELPIVEGNIIQDNNILACSESHIDKVFKMLERQTAIEFKGGLEARLVTPEMADRLRGLKIKSLWLACDTAGALPVTKRAISVLQKVGFTLNHIYCYVLIGKDRHEEKRRLEEIFAAGAIPFAQLYRNEADDIQYSQEWRSFQRRWSRPAIIKSKQKQDQVALFNEG